MKKQMKLLFIAFISLFVVTGCGEKKELKPVEVLENTLKNTQEVKSITMNTSLDIKIEQDGMIVDMPITLGMAMELEKETTGKMKLNLSENPLIGSMDLYLDMNDKESKVYMPSTIISSFMGFEEETPYWIVTETQNEEETEDESTNYQEDLEKLKNVDFGKILTDKDLVYVDEVDNVKHYTLKLTQDLMNRMATALGEEASLDDKASSLDVDLYIDTTNNRFTKISVDLLDVIKDTTEESLDEVADLGLDLSMLKELKISIELENYNSTVVQIPENVINDALTTEEYLQIYLGEE